MHDDLIAEIEAELERIGADLDAAGTRDSIGVNDEREGWASLGASEQRGDFYWYGRALDILTRLTAIEDGAGPPAVRMAFHRDVPDFDV